MRRARWRSKWRSRRRGRCRPTAGWGGWPKARRSGRSRRCSREVRGTVYARAKAQEAGYGLETELAEPDAQSDRRGGRRRWKRSRRCSGRWRRWGGGWRRCSKRRPTGSTRRRGRGSKARSTGCRGGRETLAAWIALLGRIGGSGRSRFRRLAGDRALRGPRNDVAIHRRWLDPTRPLAKAVLEPAHGVLVTSATLRGGKRLGGRGSAERGGASAAHGRPFRGRQPVRLCARCRGADRHRHRRAATPRRWPEPMRG